MLWLVVVLRVLANPCSNALQKVLAGRGLRPLWVIGFAHLGLTVLTIPWLLGHRLPTTPGFWWNLGASAALATLANTLIVHAVQRADLSLVGPVNSFKPVVSLLPGWLLLGERPTLAGLAGIALVVAGSCLLQPRGAGRPSLRGLFADRGVQLRVAALIPSAIEAVFLKRALAQATAAEVFVAWSVLGLGAVAVALIASRGLREAGAHVVLARRNLPTVAGLILTTGSMQFCTVVALAELQVGYALALFQTSSVITVLLGWAWFGETDFRRRFAAASVMAAGAAVIVLAR
jgi:drug/metabolite transporter (DMT)-like permease